MPIGSLSAPEGRLTLIRYGKTSQCAVAAASRLAEAHASGELLSSSRIATERRLSVPLVAKLLSILSKAGLVAGSRGPGGGYALARHPSTITLRDIVEVFERTDEGPLCPFGPGWCGVHAPCPLHETYVAMLERLERVLATTTLDVFAAGASHPIGEAS